MAVFNTSQPEKLAKGKLKLKTPIGYPHDDKISAICFIIKNNLQRCFLCSPTMPIIKIYCSYLRVIKAIKILPRT